MASHSGHYRALAPTWHSGLPLPAQTTMCVRSAADPNVQRLAPTCTSSMWRFLAGADAWMIEGRDRLSLVHQATGERGIGCRVAEHELDRDFALEGRVVGEIHLAHSTCADPASQLIRPDLQAFNVRVHEVCGL